MKRHPRIRKTVKWGELAATVLLLLGCDLNEPLPGGYRLIEVSAGETEITDKDGFVVVPKGIARGIGIAKLTVIDDLVVGQAWDIKNQLPCGWFILNCATGKAIDYLSESDLNRELVARGKQPPSRIHPGRRPAT